jgi:GNAT superfamily N-acetyltransferase
MTDRYLVRRALVVDAPAIARVHVQAWRESYRGIVSPRTLDGLSVERRAIGHARRIAEPVDETPTYVAVEPGAGVVGFAVCGPGRAGPEGYEGEFHAIYLLDRAKGQGLGRRLMTRMAAWLVGHDFRSAFVLVLKDNHPARRFYERLGGELCYESPFSLDGEMLVEVGYGWRDLSRFLDAGPPPAASSLDLPPRDG